MGVIGQKNDKNKKNFKNTATQSLWNGWATFQGFPRSHAENPIRPIFPGQYYIAYGSKYFLLWAPGSCSTYAAAASGGESSFREQAEMDKGTCEYDGSKEPQ